MASGAGSEDADRDFDYYMRWSVVSLKDDYHLRKFGLSVAGTKKDLAVKAFSAWDMGIAPVKTDREIRLARAQDFKAALHVSDGKKALVDPFSLTNGWVGEKEGMKSWPPTMYFDIGNFLGVKNLESRLLQDYKEGKAYSYFQAGDCT